jgi:hypothetical protein
MAASPEALPRQPCRLDLGSIDRDDFNLGAIKQEIEFTAAGLAPSTLDDDRRFEQICRRQQAHRRRLDRRTNQGGVRFVQQHGDDRRGIDHHQRGSPCSS